MEYTVVMEMYKPSGKFYTRGTYTTQEEDFQKVIEEANARHREGRLPGLTPGSDHSWYGVRVEVPLHPMNVVFFINSKENSQ